MRRFVLVSMIATSVACVNLDKPPQVADCAMSGTCVNRKADAAVTTSDAPTTLPDASVRPDESVPDTSPIVQPEVGDSSIVPVLDGGEGDVMSSNSDGPEGARDLSAPDVPAGACSAGGAPKPAGTVCRAAVDLCDVAEVCDGVSLDCPADKLAAAATPCRPTAGDCDIAETCDGTSTACPLDGFKSVGAVCRKAAGECDVAESCDGTGAACPIDSLAPSTTVCHPSKDSGKCDPAEYCTGISVTCPADAKFTKPAVPTAVTATGKTLQVDLTWTESTDATGYNVKQKNPSGTAYTTLVGSPTTAKPPFTNTGLAGATTYFYKVSAINTIATCESADSAEVSATTQGTCTPPAAPAITASPAASSVTIKWTAVTGATSYTVARSQTTGTGYTTLTTVTTGTSFTDGNVVIGTTYYYVVTASNSTCSSGNSNEAFTAPACTPPAAPTGVTITGSDNSVTLKWTAVANAVSYSIHRSPTGAEPYDAEYSTTQLTFTDSTVSNGTKYSYVVRASNGSCESANSTVVSITPACVPPSAPTGVVVTAGDKQLGLSWTAPTGATKYRVSRNTTGTGTFTQVATATTTNYTDGSLTNGTTYYYVVAASSGECWSADSAVASGTPVCKPPVVPGTLTTTPGDGQVSLSWSASTGATVYTIFRKTGATGTYASIGTATATTYLDTTAANGITYYYEVTAGNGSCDSATSAEQSATPVAACAQTAPTNVVATASGSVQVTITWTAATTTPTGGYSIARSATSGTGYVSISNVGGSASSYTDTDTILAKDTTYFYQVTANGVCAATSAEASATTACATPNVPAPTAANANGAVTISWTTINGATAYTVYRSTSATGTFTAVSSSQTAATYNDPASGLTNGTTYFYKVSASNANGQCVSAQSSATSALSCAPAAVPVGLTKTVGTTKTVKLNWTASTGATQYTILRNTTSGAEVAVGTSATNSYTDSNLTDGTTYYYKVSAQNGTNNACSSAASSEISATPTACKVLAGSESSYQSGVTSAYCFVTCWDLQKAAPVYGGLGTSNYAGRSLTINGIAVSCPTGGECTIPSNLTKDYTTYKTTGAFVFSVSAGSSASSQNYWYGTNAAHDCQ
jgi:fibronectin type 3 domain-containing protein